jgi:hypothetical protein
MNTARKTRKNTLRQDFRWNKKKIFVPKIVKNIIETRQNFLWLQ